MKNLSGKELLRGDTVIAPIKDGVVAGNIIQFYDRTSDFLIHGYALRLPAADCVLASDAYEALAKPLLAKRAKDAARAKEATEATKTPPTPSSAQETASQESPQPQ